VIIKHLVEHYGVSRLSKSGQSTYKNQYTNPRKSAKLKKKSSIGPAVVLHIGENIKQEPMCAYDFLGRPKRM